MKCIVWIRLFEGGWQLFVLVLANHVAQAQKVNKQLPFQVIHQLAQLKLKFAYTTIGSRMLKPNKPTSDRKSLICEWVCSTTFVMKLLLQRRGDVKSSMKSLLELRDLSKLFKLHEKQLYEEISRRTRLVPKLHSILGSVHKLSTRHRASLLL